MNKHDLKRKKELLETLTKAYNQASHANLYLVANKRDEAEASAILAARIHIDKAIDQLTQTV